MLKIRKATIKDLKEVQRLNLDLFKLENKAYDPSLDITWTFGPKGTKYFSQRTSGKEGMCVVAEEKGKLVGYLCGGLFERGFRKKAVYAELENILVDKKWRSQGIGKMLTLEFFQWCRQKKANYVSVTASAKNKSGIKFYRSLGFKDYDLTLEISNFEKRKI